MVRPPTQKLNSNYKKEDKSKMSDNFCQVCKCFTDVVVSDQTTSCSECGTLVVFDDEEAASEPELMGPVRPECGVSGSNGVTEEKAFPASRKRRVRPGAPPYESIAELTERMGLVATIKNRANDIYKKVIDHKPLKYKTEAAVVAACVYIACRQESKPRTVKETCSASGANLKEVSKVKDLIMRYLVTDGQDVGTVHAADFLRHFCSALGMSNREVMAAQETARNSEELSIRRSPISMAAVVIYVIAQLSNDKKAIKDVALVTRVAEGTIRNSYKDLYPHLSDVVPSWFAEVKDLNQLPPI